MNVTETGAEGLKREFRITVPAGEVEDQITKRLGEIGQAVRIPGFRPGKVPLTLLRKRFGASVRGEVLEHAVQDSSSKAIGERNLRPALPPKVEQLSAPEGGDLEYTMSLEVLPDLPEPDFAGLGLEKLVADVPDADIDKALDRMAEAQRKAETVERPAATGDIVVADVVGRIAGEEIPGSKGEGREIELGAEGLLPGFSDQLVGVSAGETREVTVTFPDDYGNPDMAGKEGVFEVAVKFVRERQPAAVDDALAEAVGLENLGELRQEIRQRMERDYNGVTRQRLKRALLDKLAERYDFAVPPGMVEMEFNSIWQQYEGEKESRKQYMAQIAANAAGAGDGEAGGGPLDGGALVAPEETALEGAADRSPAAGEAAKPEAPAQELGAAAHEVPPPAGSAAAAAAPLDAAALIAPEETALEGASDVEPAVAASAADSEEDAKARDEFQRVAERRVRLGLLLAEVGRNNNITVSQEELNQALVQEARRHPGYERQVVDFYRQNPEALDRLRAPLFEDKVVDFIVELAKPEERKVTPQELIAGAEAEEGGAAAEAEASTSE